MRRARNALSVEAQIPIKRAGFGIVTIVKKNGDLIADGTPLLSEC